MKTRQQFIDWLHAKMAQVEPLDGTHPPLSVCKRVATVVGKTAARHALGGNIARSARLVKGPEDTLALLADCLAAIEAKGDNSPPPTVSAHRLLAANRRANVHPEFLTPPQVGARYGVSPDTVRGWIRAGLLQAVAVGEGSRPRYRVPVEALSQFDARRLPQIAPAVRTQNRRRPTTSGLIVTRYSSRR